jgi:serine/threonine protein kinase
LISNFERRFTTQTQDIGTRNWMAPEVFKITQDAYIDHESPPEHARFNPSKADVYSFGLVCFELLTREVPYVGVEPASLPTQITKHGLRPQLPESCPGRLAILIQSCWKSEPRERPNFREICREMRYIKGLLLRGNYTPFLLIRVSKLNSGIQSWGSSHVETCNFEKKHNALKLPI